MRLMFCNKFYENLWSDLGDMAFVHFKMAVQVWQPPFCKLCHVTKIKKHLQHSAQDLRLKTVQVYYIE